MIAGFATREAGAYHVENLGLVVASNALIMSGPPVYAAINYIILGRVLYYVPYLAPMHPGRVITTFLGIDAVIEAMIVNGAIRMTNSSLEESRRILGANLVKSSLIIQAVMFVVFVFIAGIFHVRARRAGVLTKKLRTVLVVLYVSCTIITIRCIFRIIEFFEGWTGHLYRHEPYFWVFEASIMFVNSLIWNIWHPGARLPRSNEVYLSRDGLTELKGPGWDDDRNWVVTIFDPFDLYGIFTGKDKRTRFWEMSQEEVEAVVAEKKRNKRKWYAVLLDPFHLWGSRGLIGKHFAKNSGKDPEPTASSPAAAALGDKPPASRVSEVV
ncbi:hypothetical protein H2201_004499 [Coniosporium apollinis]|uniref:RTA1 domain-containing protein n=2 Tax=Coniosporium TaxID=2810619 RepID=A0ABQ9NWM6_9PEZI|nr:hypothetical protein H2199_005180 [Cladosporium sp. JES 115]KAJ9665421.1 hypothetical protein H2201_004499 [Coniosporium apollinis]